MIAKCLPALALSLALASSLSAAPVRQPVMVLPFENKTGIPAFDRASDWLKSELRKNAGVRVIEYYKSTNVGGILLLMLRPTAILPESQKKVTAETYYIIQGSITYSDYRYTVHVDVINSATEWVVARDTVYTIDQSAANMRSVTIRELSRRLTRKMTWKEVAPYVEKRETLPETNLAAADTPEKKEIVILYNTNETLVMDSLKGKTNGRKESKTVSETLDIPPELLKYTNQFQIRSKTEEIRFYTSPFNHNLSLDALIASDFRENTNAFYMDFDISYRYQIVSNFFLGVSAGYSTFGATLSSVSSFRISEFRFMPTALYRWFFIRPFFIDLGAGFGGYGGFIDYQSPAITYNTGLGGYMAQVRAGAGAELGRFLISVFFAFEYQFMSYADIPRENESIAVDNNNIIMTLVGISLGLGL